MTQPIAYLMNQRTSQHSLQPPTSHSLPFHGRNDERAFADALAAARRLVARHVGPGGPPLGPLMAAAVPAVDALRSQTARSAMLLLQARPAGAPLRRLHAVSAPACTRRHAA